MKQQFIPNQLPTFSIVLETENLANADVYGLVRSIASLAAQDPSPTCANEVLLVESGDTPAELLKQLRENYPWITVHYAPHGTTYYQAKMLGAKLATGEIIIYYDSDCLYTPDWLQTILIPFQDHTVQIVAGETTTGGQGTYGTAMALTYIFPQFSQQTQLTPTTQYFLNNVAFRREFLLQNSIPTSLPLYRGNCVVHAHQLLSQGYTIWQHPNAKVVHAPPNGFSHFFWRFLLIGHDYYWQKRLITEEAENPNLNIEQEDLVPDRSFAGWAGKLGIFGDRLYKMQQNNPWHLLYLPAALPIALVSALLIYAGYLITSIWPKYLLNTYEKVLGDS